MNPQNTAEAKMDGAETSIFLETKEVLCGFLDDPFGKMQKHSATQNAEIIIVIHCCMMTKCCDKMQQEKTMAEQWATNVACQLEFRTTVAK